MPENVRQMPRSDIAAALTVAAIEAEVETIRQEKSKAEAEAAARRKRQLGH
jgi:hypothetical protein